MTTSTADALVSTSGISSEQVVDSKTMPRTVAPGSQIWIVMGFFVLLGTISAMQPLVSGERREWCVYVVGTLMAPIVALAAPRLADRQAGQLLLTLLDTFVVAGATVRMYESLYAATGYMAVSMAFALPLALILLIPVWWLGRQLVSHTLTGPVDDLERGAFREQRLFACLCILAFGVLLRQTSFWFDRRIVICLSFIATFSWLTWRAWSISPSTSPSRTNNWIDGAWYVVFALGTLIPLYPPGDAFMPHWSFYQGPISLVQSGGLLLRDVPSQYGFLSILAPALLPFREAASGLHAILATMLFAQAFLMYRLIRNVRTGVSFRVWAGLAVLVTVYLFSGDRGGLGGPQEYPSTGPYRTFWVFMLAYVLMDLPVARRTSRGLPLQCLWTTVLVVIGSLWSSESAIYCLGALATTALAEGAVLTAWGLWGRDGRSWLMRYVVPVLGLAGTVLAISVFYRVRFGFFPDWFAFVEYAMKYTGTFGVLPVEPSGAVLVVGLCLGASACYAISQVVQSKDASAARLIAPYGAMIGTLSYYIARSHDSNIGNLIGMWFPLLILLYLSSRERRDQAWTTALQCMILPAFVVMTSVVTCLEPRGLTRLNAVVSGPPAPSVEAAMCRRFDQNFALVPIIREKIGDLPLTNVSAYYPYTNLPSLPNKPFLPIAPREEFFLLQPDRQRVYLERHLTRIDTPEGILFRRDPPAPWDNPEWRTMHDEVIRNINEILPRYYELQETVPLDSEKDPGYRLERWRRRS